MAQRRTAALAPWSGRLAAGAATLMSIAYVQYVVAPAFFIALIGWVVFIAWTTVVSVHLLRTAPRSSAVLTPQPA